MKIIANDYGYELVSNAGNRRLVAKELLYVATPENALQLWKRLDSISAPLNTAQVFIPLYIAAEEDKKDVARILNDAQCAEMEQLANEACAKWALYSAEPQIVIDETKWFSAGSWPLKTFTASVPVRWHRRDLAKLRKVLGEKAFHAARQQLPTTQAAQTELARLVKRKGVTLKSTHEAIAETVAGIFAGRKSHIKRGSYYPVSLVYRLAQYKSKKARAEHYRRTGIVLNALSSLLGATRDGSQTVTLLPAGSPLSAVTARAWTSEGERYSRSCTYRKQYACFAASIPYDHVDTVQARHLTYIAGMVTLAVLPIDTDRAGEECFRARCVRKGVGFSFIVEDGYIVRRGNEVSHGATLGAARGNLTRRENDAQLNRFESEVYKRIDEGRYNGAGELLVTIGDSTRAGNCEAGTLAFRDRHFAEHDSATVREVMQAAVNTGERRFAIAACLRALRRHNYAPTS